MIHRILRQAKRVVMTFLLFWAGGFLVFLSFVPTHVFDNHTKCDAIVVLTGGKDRLKTGFMLLNNGLANLLFISGVNPDVNLKSLLESRLEIQDLTKERHHELVKKTSLGYLPRNTRGNAEETAAWAREHSVKSIRLVTSAYHMPRSLLEFHVQLPQIEIVPHPVIVGGIGQQNWWQNFRILSLTVSEYTKYMVAWARITLLH